MAAISKRFIATLLVLVWACAMAAAFWWFQLRWYQPLESLTGDALFNAEQLSVSQRTPDVPIEVIHFFDSRCPCTRFNTPHVQDLMAQYQEQSIRFRILVPDASQLKEAQSLFPQVPVEVASAQDRPPASPAALVLSERHGAEYMGPWSPGAVCNSRSGDYVSQVLDQIVEGKRRNQTFQLASGCLCPWTDNSSAVHDGVSA